MSKRQIVPTWLATALVATLMISAIVSLSSVGAAPSASDGGSTISRSVVNPALFANTNNAAISNVQASAPLTATNTPTATPTGSSTLAGGKVITQDLSMSSTPGLGSLNTTIGGLPFGTGGYVLLNYDGGPNFVSCPCPLSPNANDYSVLSPPFNSVSISITRGSGLSNPITQTQTGGSAYIDSGAHKFSGLYDAGPDGQGHSMVISITNLPAAIPYRITIYTNNNPTGGSRSGKFHVSCGGSDSFQIPYYNAGQGAVYQWLLSGCSTAQIIQTNGSDTAPQGEAGNDPVGGIMFDLGNITVTTPTPMPTSAATNTATPAVTDTPAATATATATPAGSSTLVGGEVITQDLNMSSTPAQGSLNATIGGLPFGTGGYVLLNYDGGPNFISCPCPPSPNSNDYSVLTLPPFNSVSISITRGSGLSNPITQTQTGGSAFIDSGAHKFSGLYDAGPNGNGQSLIMNITGLPAVLPYRITVYDNNNPTGSARSGTMVVTTGSNSQTQLINYGVGNGSVYQWLISGSTSVQIIETNVGSSGNLPVGGIMFDPGNITIASPTPAITPTLTSTPAPTQTPGGPSATPVPSDTPTATSTPAPTNTLAPTQTPGGPTATPIPSDTPAPTNTLAPTETPGGPTDTPVPTQTPGGPTATPMPSVTPTDCPNPFVDITGNTFYVAIHYLNCRGVVNGLDATHYGPAGTSTRGQFAKVVVLGFGTPLYTPSGGQDFVDVSPSYFAYVYIESGYHAGILSGFDPATCTAHGLGTPCYLPNLPITRAQLTKLVVNAGGYTLITPQGGQQDFIDVPPSNVFYVSIETAYHNGIVHGYPGQLYLPNANIRRDEMAQIVYEGIIHQP